MENWLCTYMHLALGFYEAILNYFFFLHLPQSFKIENTQKFKPCLKILPNITLSWHSSHPIKINVFKKLQIIWTFKKSNIFCDPGTWNFIFIWWMENARSSDIIYLFSRCHLLINSILYHLSLWYIRMTPYFYISCWMTSKYISDGSISFFYMCGNSVNDRVELICCI